VNQQLRGKLPFFEPSCTRSGALAIVLVCLLLVACTAPPEAKRAGTPRGELNLLSGTQIDSPSDAWIGHEHYLRNVIDIINARWCRFLEDQRVTPPRGSHVIVTFKLNSKGETEIVKVDDSGAGKQGVLCCISAIAYPQPYRKWTEQMIAALGDEQQLTIAFYYQ